MICWGLGAFGLGLTGVLETNTKEDMGEHADLILLWGANLASQPNTARHLTAARRRGAHVVAIDVRETEAAAQSDEVIRIRPGTDAALALAMMHVIVARRASRRRVRRATHGRVRRARRPRARALAGVGGGRHRRSRGAHRRPGPALCGDAAGDDRARRQLDAQGRQRLAGRARDRLPARADRQPRHSRRRLRPAPRRPRARPGSDGHHGARAPPAGARTSRTRCRGSPRRSSMDGCACCCSSARTCCPRSPTPSAVAAGLARTDLVVCHDLFMNDTARRFADVVLPSTSWLEEVGCKSTNTHLYLMEQALEPPGETRPLIPDREGTRRAPRASRRSSSRGRAMTARSTPSSTTRRPATPPWPPCAPRAGCGRSASPTWPIPTARFDTPSGKVELHSERAAALGLPALPVYEARAGLRRIPWRFSRAGRSRTSTASTIMAGPCRRSPASIRSRGSGSRRGCGRARGRRRRGDPHLQRARRVSRPAPT